MVEAISAIINEYSTQYEQIVIFGDFIRSTEHSFTKFNANIGFVSPHKETGMFPISQPNLY